MKSLTAIAATLAVMAVASGKLPSILLQVRKAQINLLLESQATKWPKANVFETRGENRLKKTNLSKNDSLN